MKWFKFALLTVVLATVISISTGCSTKEESTQNKRDGRESDHSSGSNNDLSDQDSSHLLAEHSLGGIDSSGGNATRSSKEQVAEAIDKLKPLLKNMFVRLGNAIVSQRSLENTNQVPTDIKSILTSMFKGNTVNPKQLLTFLEDSSFALEARQEGPCTDKDGQHADASASPAGKICFSISRLTRIPPPNLQLELMALTAHELAHTYGFGETDATSLQVFLIENAKLALPGQNELKKLKEFYNITNESLTKLEVAIMSTMKKEVVCAAVGELVADALSYYKLGATKDGSVWLPHSTVSELVLFWSMAKTASSYCTDFFTSKDVSSPPSKPVGHSEFINYLVALRNQQYVIANHLVQFCELGTPAVYHNYHTATAMLLLDVFKEDQRDDAGNLPAENIGCVLREDDAVITHTEYQPPLFSPRLIHSDPALGDVYDWTYSMNLYLPDENRSIPTSISVGFRNVVLQNHKRSGFQLMLLVNVDGKNVNSKIKVRAVENAIVAIDSDQKSKIVTAVLRKQEERDHFQVNFQIPSLANKSGMEDYTLRCEVLRKKDDLKKIKIKEIRK
ncbi:MAG: hypothetical protein AB1540_09465 [Bdellovibrionota bacterium]